MALIRFAIACWILGSVIVLVGLVTIFEGVKFIPVFLSMVWSLGFGWALYYNINR